MSRLSEIAHLITAGLVVLICCERSDRLNELPVVEGGRCSAHRQHCQNAAQILSCEDRRWTRRDCVDVCVEEDPLLEALGCDLWEDGIEGSCACGMRDAAVDDGGCDHGTTHCLGKDMLLICEDRQWVDYQCTEVCADLRLPRNSMGCFQGSFASSKPLDPLTDACACTLAGTPCDAALPVFCDSVFSMARCADGLWEIEYCQPDCPLGKIASCRSLENSDQAACVCEEPNFGP